MSGREARSAGTPPIEKVSDAMQQRSGARPGSPRVTHRTISSRIVAVGTLTTLLWILAVGILGSWAIVVYDRSLATTDAQVQLTGARLDLQAQAAGLDGLIRAFTERARFRMRTLDPTAETGGSDFETWIQGRADASAIVWVALDGPPILAVGSEADAEALVSLARANPDGVMGTVALPSGPAIVALRPVVGDPPGAPVGHVAIARSVTQLDLRHPDAGVSIPPSGGADLGSADRARTIEAPEGYAAAAVVDAGEGFLARGAVLGVDGSVAMVLEIPRPDPLLTSRNVRTLLQVPVAVSVLILIVAIALSALVSRSIQRPLAGFVAYMREEGQRALHGEPPSAELEIDPRVPADLRELGQVIIDLMAGLRESQASLIEAGDHARAVGRAFRMVVDESPDAKLLVRGGAVAIANPTAVRLFGLEPDDALPGGVLGLPSGAVLLREDGTPTDLASLVADTDGAAALVRYTAEGQADRLLEMRSACAGSEVGDCVISLRDVTEDKRLEALREEVFSLVSHDLKSPLTVIRGYLDILERPLDEQRRSAALGNARQAAHRMEGLLNELLSATRAERALAPRVMRPVDVGALCTDLASSLAIGATQVVRTAVSAGAVVLGDAARIEQAVGNLVMNAIHHGPADGEIRVLVERRDDRVLIAVEDDGPGIPEPRTATAFDRGVRGDAADGVPGAGLGLYIVRLIAEAHGGTAFVDHTTGTARIVIDLPSATGAPADSA